MNRKQLKEAFKRQGEATKALKDASIFTDSRSIRAFNLGRDYEKQLAASWWSRLLNNKLLKEITAKYYNHKAKKKYEKYKEYWGEFD